VGTREYERTYATGRVLKRVGGYEITDAAADGNHVLVADSEACWRKQLQLLGGYLSFYNPLNLFRALRHDGSPLRAYRVGYQIAGFLGALRTAWKMIPYALRLLLGKKEFATEAPPASRVPVRLAAGAFPRFPGRTLYELPPSPENQVKPAGSRPPQSPTAAAF
jgi:hypothetical protein